MLSRRARIAAKSVGAISAFCFTSPDSQRGWIYESYFFEINGIPVNLELNYELHLSEGPRTSSAVWSINRSRI